MGLFDFYEMAGTYKERKVDNFTLGELVIDTAKATDGKQPYETGIQHPAYKKGDWIIVEAYDTKKEAKIGHDKWVILMTQKALPDHLEDCQNAEIASLLATFSSGRLIYKKEE